MQKLHEHDNRELANSGDLSYCLIEPQNMEVHQMCIQRCGTNIKTENLSRKSYLGTITMLVMENLCCIHAPSVQILQLWKFPFKPSSSHITVSVTRSCILRFIMYCMN
ncbi:hypothetical protein POM88_021701 [Heracleum sosnowskyi]|uniref:Uncharacterized protein n=1 Tax=Heracleum sosnowskyi TaxID=360622 RepID=A0AAD8IFD3_9APIA|nr:hypothetical protein POM88_021701 [Heracleum sosnowskyi]